MRVSFPSKIKLTCSEIYWQSLVSLCCGGVVSCQRLQCVTYTWCGAWNRDLFRVGVYNVLHTRDVVHGTEMLVDMWFVFRICEFEIIFWLYWWEKQCRGTHHSL